MLRCWLSWRAPTGDEMLLISCRPELAITLMMLLLSPFHAAYADYFSFSPDADISRLMLRHFRHATTPRCHAVTPYSRFFYDFRQLW